MSDFKREDRYIVLKISKMSDFQKDMIYPVIEEHGIPQVDCVVVEDDWPEYEAVWRMIERRVNGLLAPSRLEMKHVMQALDQVRGGPILTSNQCHDLAILLNDYLPIEDAAKSELAALREELAKANADKEAYAQNAIDLRTSMDAVNLNLSRVDEALQARTADLLACGTRRKAAEQRNATLETELRNIRQSCELSKLRDARIDALLVKPTESGASE